MRRPETLGAVVGGGADGLLKATPAHLEAVGRQLRLEGTQSPSGCLVAGGEQLNHRHLEPWRDLVRPLAGGQ